MEPALIEAAGWLEAVGIRSWASGSPWVYPAANVLHVLGLALLVGAIGILDLRIIGLWRGLPLDAMSHALTPLAVIGLVVMITSGLVLFGADGPALAGSSVFQWKLVLFALALVNVALFRYSWRARSIPGGGELPTGARALAAVSLSLWVLIAVLGRMIAYT